MNRTIFFSHKNREQKKAWKTVFFFCSFYNISSIFLLMSDKDFIIHLFSWFFLWWLLYWMERWFAGKNYNTAKRGCIREIYNNDCRKFTSTTVNFSFCALIKISCITVQFTIAFIFVLHSITLSTATFNKVEIFIIFYSFDWLNSRKYTKTFSY